MKKLYISLFVILGVLVQFVVHAVVEICYLNLLLGDFDKYGFGLSWKNWYLIHYTGTIILLVLGLTTGYLLGRHWWPWYEKRRGQAWSFKKRNSK